MENRVMVLVLGLLGVATWWLFHLPTVGKGGLFLAAGATLMPLFWEKVEVAGKMSWIAMLFVLLAVEYRAIDDEHHKNEEAQKAALTAIGNGFTGLLQQSQQQFETTVAQQQADFDATMRKTNTLLQSTKHLSQMTSDNLEAITGGKSYPEVILIFHSTDPNFLGLAAEIENTRNVGEFVYEVSRLSDTCESIPESHIVKVIAHNSTGPIQPSLRRFLSDVSLDPALEGESHYKIVMEAKNGRFLQCLDVRRNKTTGGWEHKTSIRLGNFGVTSEDWP
jgi:hypothetical protein